MEPKYHLNKIYMELNKAELALPPQEFHIVLSTLYAKIAQMAQSRNACAQQKAFNDQDAKENSTKKSDELTNS